MQKSGSSNKRPLEEDHTADPLVKKRRIEAPDFEDVFVVLRIESVDSMITPYAFKTLQGATDHMEHEQVLAVSEWICDTFEPNDAVYGSYFLDGIKRGVNGHKVRDDLEKLLKKYQKKSPFPTKWDIQGSMLND